MYAYTLEDVIVDEKFRGVKIGSGGRLVVQLNAGLSLTISTQYANLANEWAKDAFL